MKISISMATYNGAKYLPAQLNSFLEQSHLPDELIISDDGSTDETVQIASQFCANAPFEVRVLTGDVNVGYARNFNRALQESTGDLIFTCDQDDVWFPNKIQRMAEFMGKYPEVQVALCDAEFTDQSLNPIGVTMLSQLRSSGVSESCFVHGCCAVFRRELLELSLPIPKEFHAHDTWLFRLAEELHGTAIIEETLLYYRRHGDSLTNFFWGEASPSSRLRYLWKEVKASFSPRHARSGKMEKMLEQNRLLLGGAERMMSRANESILPRVESMQSTFKRRIDVYGARASLCREPFFRRIISAIYLWRRGGYQTAGGYTGFVGDVFFP